LIHKPGQTELNDEFLHFVPNPLAGIFHLDRLLPEAGLLKEHTL